MRLALAAVALVVAVGPGWASGTIGYGSRAGMEVDVVSMSGLDTTHAVIRTRHTRANAIAFCRDYVGKVTQTCIREELGQPLNDEISANCTVGTFVDFHGNRMRFTGPLKKTDEWQLAKYGIVDLATNDVADGSSASGYPTSLMIFRALCPSKVPDTGLY